MEPCCEDPENRTEPEPVDDRKDLTLTRCKVCGRRHFELAVDPGEIGLKIGA